MSDLEPTPSKGIQLLAALEAQGAITATALVLPPDVTYEECESLAAMFGQLHRTSAWLIGDLLNHIERVYGETYAQAADATGLSPGTLQNYTSVCAHIPRSRRRPKVPFSTHAEVAYLEPEEQERWLREASSKGWTKVELRQARQIEAGTLPPAVCICEKCGTTHTPIVMKGGED